MQSRINKEMPKHRQGKKKNPLANLINLTCPARSFNLLENWLNITQRCKSIHSEWKIYFNLKMFRLQQ